jgi:hypothetical protein
LFVYKIAQCYVAKLYSPFYTFFPYDKCNRRKIYNKVCTWISWKDWINIKKTSCYFFLVFSMSEKLIELWIKLLNSYYILCQIMYAYWDMKTTDINTMEVLMTDKGKGNLCLLCQRPTGSKNISVCEECIFDNNIFKSLALFKTFVHTQNQKWHPTVFL